MLSVNLSIDKTLRAKVEYTSYDTPFRHCEEIYKCNLQIGDNSCAIGRILAEDCACHMQTKTAICFLRFL